MPEQFDEIVNKIPVFKTAIDEDGAEESITHSLVDFTDMYDLDLYDIIEKGEELLHIDLDDDNEQAEDEKHNKEVFSGDESDLDSKDSSKPDPFDIYRDDDKINDGDALNHIDPSEIFRNY